MPSDHESRCRGRLDQCVCHRPFHSNAPGHVFLLLVGKLWDSQVGLPQVPKQDMTAQNGDVRINDRVSRQDAQAVAVDIPTEWSCDTIPHEIHVDVVNIFEGDVGLAKY